MKLKGINKLHLEDYFWRLVFGKSKFRSTFFELRANKFNKLPSPVFFLSTGRCGTNWFSSLLSQNKTLQVFHEPKPNFGVQGKIAYEIYTKCNFQPTATEDQLLKEILLTGREQYLRYSYKTQKRLVETNNQITFLAPAIFSLFPDTKFVHLNRHPGEFVKSALRRKFYNNVDDIKRIVPVEDNRYFKQWEGFDPAQKNSWLWTETNHFIEGFKSTIPEQNNFYFDFSSLNMEQINDLCDFLKVNLKASSVRNLLRKPVNAQKSGKVPDYNDWSDKDKKSLHQICGDLALKYNYQL